MENTVSGGTIYFYVNSAYLGKGMHIEGIAKINFIVNLPNGTYLISGIYDNKVGNDTILNGTLLVNGTESTIVSVVINSNKVTYIIGETTKFTVKVSNIGNAVSRNVTIVFKLPKNFTLS